MDEIGIDVIERRNTLESEVISSAAITIALEHRK